MTDSDLREAMKASMETFRREQEEARELERALELSAQDFQSEQRKLYNALALPAQGFRTSQRMRKTPEDREMERALAASREEYFAMKANSYTNKRCPYAHLFAQLVPNHYGTSCQTNCIIYGLAHFMKHVPLKFEANSRDAGERELHNAFSTVLDGRDNFQEDNMGILRQCLKAGIVPDEFGEVTYDWEDCNEVWENLMKKEWFRMALARFNVVSDTNTDCTSRRREGALETVTCWTNEDDAKQVVAACVQAHNPTTGKTVGHYYTIVMHEKLQNGKEVKTWYKVDGLVVTEMSMQRALYEIEQFSAIKFLV